MKERLLNLILRLAKKLQTQHQRDDDLRPGTDRVGELRILHDIYRLRDADGLFGPLDHAALDQSWLATGGLFGTVIAIQS